MYEVDPAFAPDKLVKGRVYRFRARNFFYGVWNGESGFIGIREKFHSIYLFTEYHADQPFGGTAWWIEDHLPIADAPTDLEIRERFDPICGQCKQGVEFRPDVPGTRAPGRQYHLDAALDADHDPHGQVYTPPNTPLLLWLAQFEENEAYRNFIVAVVNEPDVNKQEDMWDAYIKQRRKEMGWDD